MAGQPVAASFRCGPTGVPGAGGPGHCVCRWAAARPRAVRAVCCCLWLRWCSGRRRARPPARSPHASLRLGSVDLEARPCPPDPPAPSTPAALGVLTCGWVRRLKAWPGPAAAHRHRGRPRRRPPAPRQDPPAPTGTAAGPSGALHTSGAGCTDVWLGASARCPARPRRRPRALQSGPPVPPAPSTPVGPGVLTFVTSAAHWSSGQAPPPPTGTAVWPSGPSGSLHTGGAVSLECGWGRVVTNVVNPRCFLCGFLIRCYKRRQSEGFFADYGGFWAWIDDVCHRGLREAI